MCTDVFGISVADCETPNSNVFCTQWADRDNNICNGDFGGPAYSYYYSDKTLIQEVVGLASYSPNQQANAPCKGGHTVEYTQVAAYSAWIQSVIFP